MEFPDPQINAYAEAHTTQESAVLKALNRETHANVLMPRMLSGHLQGEVLKMISLMIKPEQILEIGTYTGYSAICLAAGLKDGGKLHTIDINDELAEMVNRYFSEAGLKDKIEYHLGNALNIIPSLKGPFDLV